MPGYSTTIQIAAPPARVWEVMRDVERWPEWTSTVTEARPLGKGPLAVGSAVRLRQPKMSPAVWRVTSWDEGSGFIWSTRRPGLRVTAEHRIEPSAPGSTVTLSVAFAGPVGAVVGRLARALTERYLAQEAAGLKQRSEDGSPD